MKIGSIRVRFTAAASRCWKRARPSGSGRCCASRARFRELPGGGDRRCGGLRPDPGLAKAVCRRSRRLPRAADRRRVDPSARAGAAQRHRCRFYCSLGRTTTIIRGPKPARALRALGLAPQLRAEEATTEGIVALLSGLELRGRRVGVQLYPEAPGRLADFLEASGALPDPVTPYAYAAAAPDEALAGLIEQVVAGGSTRLFSPAPLRPGACSRSRGNEAKRIG